MNTKSGKAIKNVQVAVGNRLADLRVKQGYPTIKEFAIKHDLPEIHYWRIEKGKTNITLKSLVKILTIYGMTLSDFFCEVPEDQQII